MNRMTTQIPRKIIDDFAKEIKEKCRYTAKPPTTVINFRTEMREGFERDIGSVPINILRYRKDNGRISSDVIDYETNIGPLDEKDEKDQEIIRKFLENKDPEKTATLIKSIMHDGQREPAIITRDGFLINGNRRKMVMERLNEEYPNDEKYAYMKVVVLPGKDDEGGPPTQLEIEKIENRYQLQSSGKSEYYGFDRSLSIRRKIKWGLSLKEQLLDDPRYAGASDSELQKVIREYEKEYLQPLECVDRYLIKFNREGLYRTISTGISDPEGRWQAFIDYGNSYYRHFCNPRRQIEIGIEEDEIGTIEDAAFKMIRLRTLGDQPKIHVLMRELPKWVCVKEAKKELCKISDEVDEIMSHEESIDKNGSPYSSSEIDKLWAKKHQQAILYHVNKASEHYKYQKEKETPITLLRAAYNKLTHEDMDMTSVDLAELGNARKIVSDIQERAGEIESEIYECQKRLKKLTKKK